MLMIKNDEKNVLQELKKHRDENQGAIEEEHGCDDEERVSFKEHFEEVSGSECQLSSFIFFI
jgi:hypothetical protein